MEKNDLLRRDNEVIRILEIQPERVFVIDCMKRTMPVWMSKAEFTEYGSCCLQDLLNLTDTVLYDVELLDAKSQQKVRRRFTVIAELLPIVSNVKLRNKAIREVSCRYQISQQTIRSFLCSYLVYQDISALVPKKHMAENELSDDEKTMRWALNKFFYTKNKNSLKTAYTMMLQAKYCDGVGQLLPCYPTFNQFRYFYRKHKNMRTYYISRDGVKSYERNNRPLLGDGVQEYASHVGVGMFDATACDIYLVDDSGNLVGRPILTACVDAFSSICIGYMLSWEGGVYSLRGLLLNMIADKKTYCEKFGILVENGEWDCSQLPAEMITDMGSEYISDNFEQITDLGVTLVNLPSYRPELKGVVEKFFDCIQGYFKPHLKGKGIIEPDFRERGARDYRKDACLTMADFEKVIIRCIIYYNSKRILENYPYSEDMLKAKIQPYASMIWEWGKQQSGANLIKVDADTLILTLLPRTEGRFTRFGLKVNRMRYHSEGYTEEYLNGGKAAVAYNPDDVSMVWLFENGEYTQFDLIESRFKGKPLAEVEAMQESQKELVKNAAQENLQAKIDLAEHIQAISGEKSSDNVDIKGIRKTKRKEQSRQHIDYVKEGGLNGSVI